jgi:hypothetical protein
MNLITFYIILMMIGINITEQLENSIINLLNEDEVYLYKFVLSFILQTIIIILAYDFNILEYMRIMYFMMIIIIILTVFPPVFYHFIEINIVNLSIELQNITL